MVKGGLLGITEYATSGLERGISKSCDTMRHSLISASENRIFEIVLSCICNDRDMLVDGDRRGMNLRGNREVTALSYGNIDMRRDNHVLNRPSFGPQGERVPWDEGMWRLGTKRSGTDRAVYRILSECLRMCATGPSVGKSTEEIPALLKLTVCQCSLNWTFFKHFLRMCLYILIDDYDNDAY